MRGHSTAILVRSEIGVVPLHEEVHHFIPKIRIGRELNELQGLKLTIKRLHLLTLAAAGGPELCEELTSVSTASHHETLMLGVVDETDDHVESSLAHVLPNRLGDIIWASRKVKELSIADRRAAVQNESLRALGGAPVSTGKLARCGARLEEEETD